MHKFKMPLMTIQIGHNILIIFILLLFSAFQCGEKIEPKDNNYVVWIHNVTPNDISIIYNEYGDISPMVLITANDSINQFNFNPFGYNNNAIELDPVKQMFTNFFLNETLVYRNDSLKVTWEGPAVDLPDSIHSFYNYNSWEVELTPNVAGQTGTINFYIEEADLK